MPFKKGARIWRGYARVFIEGGEWFPEIRPGRVSRISEDGSLELHMDGVMPGSERRRNPGGWLSRNIDPANVADNPHAALDFAIECARVANMERKAK
jgi:hypothetical protein